MRFGAYDWLWALTMIPVLLGLFYFAARRRRRMAAVFAEWGAWLNLTSDTWTAARRWKSVLFLFGIVCLILALTRPQWGARAVMLQRRGLDIIVALDVSRSMLVTDVKPNRLTRAKREIGGILDRLKGDRFGLIIFAGDAFVQCPLTIDVSAGRVMLDAVNYQSAGRPGTAIADAIASATGMFDPAEKKFKVLILVTDGESHEGDALAEARKAADQGIRIFTLGIGTPGGEPVPVYDDRGQQSGFKKDDNGQVVLSKLDEVTLQKVALATQGRYFRVGHTESELNALFEELALMEKKELEGRLFTEFEERFQYLLLPAFVFLFAAAIIPETRPRRNPVRPPRVTGEPRHPVEAGHP